MTASDKRLIEAAFPLKQTSMDSVHEKNVRHGHISTLHIWPARRPLAASRAALIATLLPDPGDPEERKAILERMAGRVVEKIERRQQNGRTVEKKKEETVGGILHWGRENDPDLQWFRDEIRKAYGGRAPKVLDPFAGGGAIPLEAMRLGCEVTAMDINPVAWFILKCTLEYPQKLAGQTLPLPEFVLSDHDFMEAFFKAKGYKGVALRTLLERFGHSDKTQLDLVQHDDPLLEADLAWHVRAWGRWVLDQARRELASFYPTYAEFQPLIADGELEARPIRLLNIDGDGGAQVEPLNAEYDDAYLKQPTNARWIAKPTVSYLWARTVKCKQCRATLPLLKTRWLCKKDNKRVILTMDPNADETGVVFGVDSDVPRVGGNAAQRREHDRRVGDGTLSQRGVRATCPCCCVVMTKDDIQFQGRAGDMGSMMTAVVVDGPKGKGKEYRLPTDLELAAAKIDEKRLSGVYADIPFGLPQEPIHEDTKRNTWCVQYGLDTWQKLFTDRQLLAIGEFVRALRSLPEQLASYPEEWKEALFAMCSPMISRMVDRGSTVASWTNDRETIRSTFAGFKLPVTWDFAEFAPLSDTTGGFVQSVDWVSKACNHLQNSVDSAMKGDSVLGSAVACPVNGIDLIITDPPYYDAIGYSVLMDFFYVWLRRTTHGLSSEVDSSFHEPLGPKWDHEIGDGELIDDASRFNGNKDLSKQNYEKGLFRAFQSCHSALRKEGRLVVVFANKQPDAWETLVGSI